MKLSHETYPILKWEIVKLGIAASTVSPSLSQEIIPSGVLLSLPLSLHICASSFEWQASSATQMQKSGTFSPSLLHRPLRPPSPQPHRITSSFLSTSRIPLLSTCTDTSLDHTVTVTHQISATTAKFISLPQTRTPNLFSSLQSKEPSKMRAFA